MKMVEATVNKTRTKGSKYYNWKLTWPKAFGDEHKHKDSFKVEIQPYGNDYIVKVVK